MEGMNYSRGMNGTIAAWLKRDTHRSKYRRPAWAIMEEGLPRCVRISLARRHNHAPARWYMVDLAAR
jgi:hypothetical protein